MNSLMQLWTSLLHELEVVCSAESTTRDLETARERYEHEGDSFLTITLPNFGKDFERCLEAGKILDDAFPGWRRRKSASSPKGMSKVRMAPVFLGPFLDLVFSSEEGLSLLDDPNHNAVFAVRQLTLMFGKLRKPCTPERENAALARFIETEDEIGRLNDVLTSEFLEEFTKASHMIWGSVLEKIDRKVYQIDIVPNHGPGVTADRLLGNQKFVQQQWTHRLEQWFPSGIHLFPSWSYYEELQEIDFVDPEHEIPVKVICVPKTLKTPRIIAVEPTCMQYAQQGLLKLFVEYIEHGDYAAFGMVGFRSQTPNREMAEKGSAKGLNPEDGLATLDLSDASDRVSNQLVLAMTSYYHALSGGIQACRSVRANVPGYGVIPLSKFASMGSALTFPMEAMVFTTLALMGIAKSLGVPLTSSLIYKLRGKVRVFGDDIIVPKPCADIVIDYLEAYGLKVNRSKSFKEGYFRESCGKEFFQGTDVSIVRCREELPASRRSSTEIISAVSLRNQLYMAGLWQTSRQLDILLDKILIHYPLVADTSPVLGKVSMVFDYEDNRTHPYLHSPLVRGYCVSAKPPKSELDGVGALLKFFIQKDGSDEPNPDPDHLKRSGRPKSTDIKLRWASPF